MVETLDRGREALKGIFGSLERENLNLGAANPEAVKYCPPEVLRERGIARYLREKVLDVPREELLRKFGEGVKRFYYFAHVFTSEGRRRAFGNDWGGVWYKADLLQRCSVQAGEAEADYVLRNAGAMRYWKKIHHDGMPTETDVLIDSGTSNSSTGGVTVSDGLDAWLLGPTHADCGFMAQAAVWFGFRNLFGCNEVFDFVFGGKYEPFYLTATLGLQPQDEVVLPGDWSKFMGEGNGLVTLRNWFTSEGADSQRGFSHYEEAPDTSISLSHFGNHWAYSLKHFGDDGGHNGVTIGRYFYGFSPDRLGKNDDVKNWGTCEVGQSVNKLRAGMIGYLQEGPTKVDVEKVDGIRRKFGESTVEDLLSDHTSLMPSITERVFAYECFRSGAFNFKATEDDEARKNLNSEGLAGVDDCAIDRAYQQRVIVDNVQLQDSHPVPDPKLLQQYCETLLLRAQLAYKRGFPSRKSHCLNIEGFLGGITKKIAPIQPWPPLDPELVFVDNSAVKIRGDAKHYRLEVCNEKISYAELWVNQMRSHQLFGWLRSGSSGLESCWRPAFSPLFRKMDSILGKLNAREISIENWDIIASGMQKFVVSHPAQLDLRDNVVAPFLQYITGFDIHSGSYMDPTSTCSASLSTCDRVLVSLAGLPGRGKTATAALAAHFLLRTCTPFAWITEADVGKMVLSAGVNGEPDALRKHILESAFQVKSESVLLDSSLCTGNNRTTTVTSSDVRVVIIDDDNLEGIPGRVLVEAALEWFHLPILNAAGTGVDSNERRGLFLTSNLKSEDNLDLGCASESGSINLLEKKFNAFSSIFAQDLASLQANKTPSLAPKSFSPTSTLEIRREQLPESLKSQRPTTDTGFAQGLTVQNKLDLLVGRAILEAEGIQAYQARGSRKSFSNTAPFSIGAIIISEAQGTVDSEDEGTSPVDCGVEGPGYAETDIGYPESSPIEQTLWRWDLSNNLNRPRASCSSSTGTSDYHLGPESNGTIFLPHLDWRVPDTSPYSFSYCSGPENSAVRTVDFITAMSIAAGKNAKKFTPISDADARLGETWEKLSTPIRSSFQNPEYVSIGPMINRPGALRELLESSELRLYSGHNSVPPTVVVQLSIPPEKPRYSRWGCAHTLLEVIELLHVRGGRRLLITLGNRAAFEERLATEKGYEYINCAASSTTEDKLIAVLDLYWREKNLNEGGRITERLKQMLYGWRVHGW